METITLTRKQIDQFVQFAVHFKDVQWMTLEQDDEIVRIKCSLFGNDSEPETTVDITDVNAW